MDGWAGGQMDLWMDGWMDVMATFACGLMTGFVFSGSLLLSNPESVPS